MQGHSRRRPQEPAEQRRFAGFHAGDGSSDDLALWVLGLPCTLFYDDGVAAMLDSERHLQPWCGNDEVRVDRYDVRLLLDSLRQFDDEPDDADELRQRWLATLNEEQLEEEQEAELERWADLPSGPEAAAHSPHAWQLEYGQDVDEDSMHGACNPWAGSAGQAGTHKKGCTWCWHQMLERTAVLLCSGTKPPSCWQAGA